MSITDDKAKFQKLEKAEILEMVVSHMRNIQMSGGAGNSSENSHDNSTNLGFYYAIAYRQCLNEFQSFLSVFPDVNDEFKARIMGYMTQRYMDIVASMNKSNVSNENVATPTNLPIKKEKKHHSNRYSPYSTNNKQKSTPTKQEKDNLSILTNNEQNMSTMSASSNSSASSYNFYTQANKYGGSCSSLDSYQPQTQPQSPSNDSTSSSAEIPHRSAHMSPSSSPVQLNCSSPNSALAAKQMLMAHSDLMFTNFELYQNCLMKVWRPW